MKAWPFLTSKIVDHRFVKKTDTCWLWTGSKKPGGYGQKTIKEANGIKKPRLVHRISYAQEIGPIPEGMKVCHRCDVRHCLNPSHLFLGTQKENLEDMAKKGRWHLFRKKRTHCKWGHRYDKVVKRNPNFQRCSECEKINARSYVEKNREKVNAKKRLVRRSRAAAQASQPQD